jgi:hypothetical protein
LLKKIALTGTTKIEVAALFGCGNTGIVLAIIS